LGVIGVDGRKIMAAVKEIDCEDEVWIHLARDRI
jgi:hypothetical protein